MHPKRKISPPIEDIASLRQPMTAGEKLVLNLFNKHLPPDWEIYIQPHLNGLRPDFILLSPTRGIAVFEVKDWNLNAMNYFTKEYKSKYDETKYYSLWAEKNGEEFCIQSQNPITKVNTYKKKIFDLYCPRIQAEKKKMGWAAITAGVIFPFAPKGQVIELFSQFLKKTPPKYWHISGKEDISSENIKVIFPEFARENSRLIKEEWVKDLRGWLEEPDFVKIQREPFKLDPDQKLLANTRRKSGYRRIRGPAGSGKSLVLAARAARLASEGKSVLMITFNITLWHYLYDLTARALLEMKVPVKKNRDNIIFTHFHGWCKDICEQVGWDDKYNEIQKQGNALISKEQKEDFFNNQLPLLAEEAIMQPEAPRYDAILVDEGQDYQLSWWNILRKVCKPEGEMILVADATQDIYGTAKAWTDEAMRGAGFSGIWAQLKTSYRLPPDIISHAQEFANKFLPLDSVDLPQPEQDSLDLYPCYLRWVQCKLNETNKTCLEEINSLMHQTGKNGLANADISLITKNLDSGRQIVEYLEKDKIDVIHTFDAIPEIRRSQKMAFYMGNAKIKATTLHSFKGWECPILLLHIETANKEDLPLIYAGLTRLKRRTEGSWLTVVCSAAMLSAYGKTWPNYIHR